MTRPHRSPTRRIVDADAVVVDLEQDPISVTSEHDSDRCRPSVLHGGYDELLGDRDEERPG